MQIVQILLERLLYSMSGIGQYIDATSKKF